MVNFIAPHANGSEDILLYPNKATVDDRHVSLVLRFRHSHYGEGGRRYVGTHHRGHHAAGLPDLQCHVCVHGGISHLSSQVSQTSAACVQYSD